MEDEISLAISEPEKSDSKTGNEPLTNFDSVFKRIGSFGLYQWIIFIMIQYATIQQAAQFSLMTFGSITPKYYCNSSLDISLSTKDANREYCAAKSDGTCSTENHTKIEFYSIVEDWHLVCGMDFVPTVILTAQMIVEVIIGPFYGMMVDLWGRKLLMVAGFTGAIGAGCLGAASTTWQMLLSSVVLNSFFGGLFSCGRGYFAIENVGPRHRIPMSCAFQWIIVVQFVALIAFLTGSWRNYLWVANGVCVPVILILILLPESPRWLIQKKRFKEAHRAIEIMAKINGRTGIENQISLKEVENLVAAESTEKSPSWRSSVKKLMSNKRFLIYLAWGSACGFFVVLSMNVILFGLSDLAGSVFLNMSLFGLTRIWAPLVMIGMEWKTKWFGRRMLFLTSGGLVTFCFTGIVTIHLLGKQNDWQIMKTILAQFGSAMSASLLYTAWSQYSIELYPTLVRGTAGSIVGLFAGIASVVTPEVLYLKKYWSAFPYATVAFVGIITWVFGLIVLPETKGKPLPDSFESNNQKDNEVHV